MAARSRQESGGSDGAFQVLMAFADQDGGEGYADQGGNEACATRGEGPPGVAVLDAACQMTMRGGP